MKVKISETELAKRSNKIRTLLSIINNSLYTTRLNPDKNTTSLILKDSSTSSNDFPFFKTKNKNLKASYVEIWIKDIQKDEWTLSKSNFNLMIVCDFNDYKELIAFHNDFEVGVNVYKSIPHIHVKHPKLEYISNAHIALNLTDHDKINELNRFDANFKEIIKMINNEFIMSFH